MKKELNYNEIIRFAEAMGINLLEYQKEILRAICDNKIVIYPRQFGRGDLNRLLYKYAKSKNNKMAVM